MKMVTISLPKDVWQSVSSALLDFQRFGPGELDSEYIPEEHLDKARRAIEKAVEEKK